MRDLQFSHEHVNDALSILNEVLGLSAIRGPNDLQILTNYCLWRSKHSPASQKFLPPYLFPQKDRLEVFWRQPSLVMQVQHTLDLPVSQLLPQVPNEQTRTRLFEVWKQADMYDKNNTDAYSVWQFLKNIDSVDGALSIGSKEFRNHKHVPDSIRSAGRAVQRAHKMAVIHLVVHLNSHDNTILVLSCSPRLHFQFRR